jgi:hypothetical protein
MTPEQLSKVVELAKPAKFINRFVGSFELSKAASTNVTRVDTSGYPLQ